MYCRELEGASSELSRYKPVTKVSETCEARSEYRFQSLPILASQGEVELQIVFDLLSERDKHDEVMNPTRPTYEFSHRLLCLCLCLDIDSKGTQMCRESGIQLGVITEVTIDIYGSSRY